MEAMFQYLRQHGPEWATNLAAAAVIIFISYIVARLIAGAARRQLYKREDERIHTLAPIIATMIVAVGTGIGIVMGLDKLGLDVGALLAGAGIIGLAIGFGAQSLVKDWLTGFFLILDGAIGVGDFISVGDRAGTVEKVGLRMTRVRSFDGYLWYIPNGEIREVGNFSREWVRAIVNVGLAYEEDTGKGIKTLQEVGDAWAKEHADWIIDPPVAQGVLDLADSSVNVRLVVKLIANGEVWAVERELRTRVKAAFDEAGVEIPFPRSVVYHRKEQDAGPLEVLSTEHGDKAA